MAIHPGDEQAIIFPSRPSESKHFRGLDGAQIRTSIPRNRPARAGSGVTGFLSDQSPARSRVFAGFRSLDSSCFAINSTRIFLNRSTRGVNSVGCETSASPRLFTSIRSSSGLGRSWEVGFFVTSLFLVGPMKSPAAYSGSTSAPGGTPPAREHIRHGNACLTDSRLAATTQPGNKSAGPVSPGQHVETRKQLGNQLGGNARNHGSHDWR